ncbi:hypothetical protein Goe27_00880 [Bacillus phage vB_BsuM-Goe27]|uniref:Uncharacterized protein n=1 Tax=Bacillus phage vB_BsuM-Goe3 TaxID=1933063 RepID=A0A217ER41_BPGO3|nr:hypothetical protein HWB07_gp220 [Bacillus phage vB_BsuM-Goe3]AYJ75952.1 hypothetical protein BSP14_077 [Bacillus phage BSP14]QDP43113.1 hypothetical protein Goe7_c00880 [Bacillus phage vB_BveM-Goe7]WCS69462.1 hypothetical protein Goe24_00870 [Bacillus phage vB_BsuM-Goe24]WCS69966.1 hypothetical protein Goe27_00880 [Bacillus phage vB_BsuM-Goe27]APZ82550.1 hypothetical protein Goe3_c08900 [Bacillus phage vB_BsuM-Goe3]
MQPEQGKPIEPQYVVSEYQSKLNELMRENIYLKSYIIQLEKQLETYTANNTEKEG